MKVGQMVGTQEDHAPLAIFLYKRPMHTDRLLRSLARNPEFASSPVFVFSDGPKTDEDMESVDEVRRICRALTPPGTNVIERCENLGLAGSLIAGITELCDRYGRVIVAEDDLIFSPLALAYYNQALRRYENDEQVMHIAGYMFPVGASLPDTFFYREASCWGWATWKRAWSNFNDDASFLIAEIEKRNLVKRFNIEDSMYYMPMLEKQARGELDSWAIRWYASVLLANGLALHPGRPFVQNEGFDGTGVHCKVTDAYRVKLRNRPVRRWPKRIEEEPRAVRAMIEYRSQQRKIGRAKRGGLLGSLSRGTRQVVAAFAKLAAYR